MNFKKSTDKGMWYTLETTPPPSKKLDASMIVGIDFYVGNYFVKLSNLKSFRILLSFRRYWC